jgi:hypothetical protein
MERLLIACEASLGGLETQRRRAFLVQVLELGPLGDAMEQLLGQRFAPAQVFQSLMDRHAPEVLLECGRVIDLHVELSAHWEAEGEYRQAAALLGLLLRLGLASGSERLTSHGVERLGHLLVVRPEYAALSMEPRLVMALSRAWRVGQDQHALEQLAEVLEQRPRPEASDQEILLERLVISERLLSTQARNASHSASHQHRPEILLRLLDLCEQGSALLPELARRGLDLLPRLGAAWRHRPTFPLQFMHLMVTAQAFAMTLERAGSATARQVLMGRLLEQYRALAPKWAGHPSMAGLVLHLARQRREPGMGSEVISAESMLEMLHKAERATAERNVRSQLQTEAYMILLTGCAKGDGRLVALAQRHLDTTSAEGLSVDAILARADLQIHLQGAERLRRQRASEARRIMRQGFEGQALSVSQQAHWLLLRARSGLAQAQPVSRWALLNTSNLLRQAVTLLMPEVRATRQPALRLLLARALLSKAYIQVQEAQRWGGQARHRLADQALRDARYAARLFQGLEQHCAVVEAMWIQAAAFLHLEDEASRESQAEARVCILGALELLERLPEGRGAVGAHATSGTLYVHLRCAYVQLGAAKETAPAPLQALPKMPALRHVDSASWVQGAEKQREFIEERRRSHAEWALA